MRKYFVFWYFKYLTQSILYLVFQILQTEYFAQLCISVCCCMCVYPYYPPPGAWNYTPTFAASKLNGYSSMCLK